ncbi:hypothetical protein ARAM_007336 [Aspergillus rambellii]|uniref:Survival protein SurE-like phosphatase/nucleotidase domain-containing protein n=1 Tax=Aspergillus rambellii TaxID=308745 RepID=A0A0F8UWA1_9EURO|nr:hypothetical protein ARAM_007336 [Aspergillus rambellii]
MRFPLAAATLPLAAQAINIISSNDDGWAEINIRSLYGALTAVGYSVVVSAPAENESGTGSLDIAPSDRTEPCEFNSCPADSGAYGNNATDPHLNWVNSYPVTSIKHGIEVVAPQFFGGNPDLAVSGPNIGNNLGLAVLLSGTVGAANYAAGTAGIPAIAFSGDTGSQTAWNATLPVYSAIYAQLATKVTERIVAAGAPYLPDGVWLNVNFPAVSDSSCASVGDFAFVLSRIYTAVPLLTSDDVETCGSKRLPTETTVVDTDGCYVSISVGDSNKLDANATLQGDVLEKLGDFLTCLP